MAWEEETRREEIRLQRWGSWTGLAALIIGSITAGAAVYAAWQAAEAVSTAQEAVVRSSREQRLTNGIEAMGGDSAAQRIAGLGLMGRSVAAEVRRVSEPGLDQPGDTLARDRREALAAYLSVLDALENYVGAWAPGATADERPPKDVYYATGELKRLLDPTLADRLHDLGAEVGVDLSFARLPGVNWRQIDLSWLDSHYLRGIDLRNAILVDSRWGTTSLQAARLQCANLTGADLRGTDLRFAHLEGADLRGADLTGAMMFGADLTGAVVDSVQLSRALGVDHTIRRRGPPGAVVASVTDQCSG